MSEIKGLTPGRTPFLYVSVSNDHGQLGLKEVNENFILLYPDYTKIKKISLFPVAHAFNFLPQITAFTIFI